MYHLSLWNVTGWNIFLHDEVDGVYKVEVRIIVCVRARRQKVCHGLSLISPDRPGLNWYRVYYNTNTCITKQYIKHLQILLLPCYHIFPVTCLPAKSALSGFHLTSSKVFNFAITALFVLSDSSFHCCTAPAELPLEKRECCRGHAPVSLEWVWFIKICTVVRTELVGAHVMNLSFCMHTYFVRSHLRVGKKEHFYTHNEVQWNC